MEEGAKVTTGWKKKGEGKGGGVRFELSGLRVFDDGGR